ncbi:LruC domain-containing protein [Mucilaginibacter oryzae]|uniref:LruC domain-containing protein n=1 Tax=Mucilaginibacter oryzae TaxID=468058 RepID=A0A316HFJ6_9SPHI|nr:LruC domain-containing protein [Mucilaginibacter oryzae]PWK79348.1 LruC domain-containing protein [Mucilaginibacter oryzae]
MNPLSLKTYSDRRVKIHLLLILFVSAILISSCKKESSSGLVNTPPPVVITPGDSVIAPENFNFSTTKLVSLKINLQSNNNEPIAGVPVDVFVGDPATSTPILTSLSDNNGLLQAQVNLPAYVDTLIVDAKYVGLMRNAKAVIVNNAVNGTIGGSAGFSGNISQNSYVSKSISKMRTLNSFSAMASNSSNTIYKYMGLYDNSGVPKYLEPTYDVITADLLSFINASLPETIDVRKHHPQYLQSSAVADLNVTETADVWITFVSEGAGYLNSLGYYTYTTGNPPKSPADIATVNYIFPNASLPGSGGNLRSGSKVKLGRFNAGTSIGFVLLANAWDGGSKTVSTSTAKFYSTTACNPETTADLKKHTVLLYSETQNLFLIGIDDQNRQTGGSDNDFNDIVFYATSNPIKAISQTDVQPIDKPIDSDGDGVTDTFDQFPTDPTRAYVSYYPSKTTFGTTLFEDLWPATGDYDMNDMVIGYRYKTVTNAKNLAVEIYADYAVKASGASFVSGFGVQFPFGSNMVQSVTGQKRASNYIKQNGNGTESGQAKAVIIPFDSYQAVIKRPGGYYINTQNGAPFITGDTVHIRVNFTTPISAATLGTAPFNPFLISNQRRGYEVHLPNNLPTDLADQKLFGTLQDYSKPGLNSYYKTKNAWPWALNFVEQFDYPSEGSNIGKTYNYFLQWAKSGGALHPDWYLSTAGNRNESMIYRK